MAQIVTITNPLTGQPAQVDQLDHTAQEIDDAIVRALPGGEIDTLLSGKAPAGYGLGMNANTSIYDADNITAFGFYTAKTNTPTNDWCAILNIPYWQNRATQFSTLCEALSANKYSYCKREKIDGIWKPWEWVNPRMELGVEYRTTERFGGSPVYTKAIDLSTWPGDGVITSLGSDNVKMFTEAFLTTRMGVVNQGKSSFGLNFEVAPSANYLGGSSSDMTGVLKTYGTDAWGGTKILIVKYTKSA